MVSEADLGHTMFQDFLDHLFSNVTLMIANPSVASSDAQTEILLNPW